MTALRGAVVERWRKAVDLRAGEGPLLAWAALYILSLMSAYYVLRPLRDALGVEAGVEHLQWLFTGTLIAMLAANPLYASLVRRLPVRRFIPVVYGFFILNLALFGWAMSVADSDTLRWIGRVFFVWISVFNLFVVSVFWALMVDIFDAGQARRLFGLLSAAATVGAMLGSGFVVGFARKWPGWALPLCSALLLLGAIVCVDRILRRLAAPATKGAGQARVDQRIGGSVWAGLRESLRSPYLLNIGGYILLYTITSTFLYFQQATVARDAFPNAAARTQFFASVDLAVNVLTLTVQVFATGRILKWFGVSVAIIALPLLTLIGFGMLAVWPTMIAIVGFQVLRRVGNFGLAKPTREVLFTVVPREDKYKAKSVLDTVVYRLGDQMGSWTYAGLAAAGLGVAGVAAAALPLAAAWIVNAWWLGRRWRAMESQSQTR